MKKSVVLPYERYQQLLKNSSTTSSAVKVHSTEEEAAADVAGGAIDDSNLIDSIEPKAKQRDEKLRTEIIVACLPKNNRQKALRLLQYIDQHPILDWNESGTLLIEKEPVALSHIVDLLHDALNTTKYEPIGLHEFYTHLGNIPQSLINNPKRKSLIGRGRRLPPPGLPSTQPKPLNTWKAQWTAL